MTRRRLNFNCVACGAALKGNRGRSKYCPPCRQALRCSIPGCDRKVWNTDDVLCHAHRLRPEVVGGIHCQICGMGPRTSLTQHVIRDHDGTVAYKRQFGPRSLTSENFRLIQVEKYKDQKEDLGHFGPKKQKVCKNGHPMSGKNIIFMEVTTNGRRRPARLCRMCAYARMKEWRDRRRQDRRR